MTYFPAALARIEEPAANPLALRTLIGLVLQDVEDACDQARRGLAVQQSLSRTANRLRDLQDEEVVLDRVAVYTSLVVAESDLLGVLEATSAAPVIREVVRALGRLSRAQRALRSSDVQNLRGLRAEVAVSA